MNLELRTCCHGNSNVWCGRGGGVADDEFVTLVEKMV